MILPTINRVLSLPYRSDEKIFVELKIPTDNSIDTCSWYNDRRLWSGMVVHWSRISQQDVEKNDWKNGYGSYTWNSMYTITMEERYSTRDWKETMIDELLYKRCDEIFDLCPMSERVSHKETDLFKNIYEDISANKCYHRRYQWTKSWESLDRSFADENFVMWVIRTYLMLDDIQCKKVTNSNENTESWICPFLIKKYIST